MPYIDTITVRYCSDKNRTVWKIIPLYKKCPPIQTKLPFIRQLQIFENVLSVNNRLL